jgi:hypothetical protein
MPASLPGDTLANNLANPNAGRMVTFDLLSGPKGSPFDVRKISYVGTVPTYTNDAANQKPSTGALSTGIGFGSPPIIGPISNPLISNALAGIRSAGFSDDYTVGVTLPNGNAAADSRLMYIGGGKTSSVGATTGRPFPPAPYTAGFGIGNAGNGGSRDAGAGPAFTGFGLKTVTAAGAVAAGAAVEAGFTNRSGVALVADQSVFGSATAASAAPA